MKSHLLGKRHLRRAEEQRKRKDEVECSVFVRGFPSGTTEGVLRSSFSRFGKVANVFLETERVRNCILAISRRLLECLSHRMTPDIKCGQDFMTAKEQSRLDVKKVFFLPEDNKCMEERIY